jgi:hypothetical protein
MRSSAFWESDCTYAVHSRIGSECALRARSLYAPSKRAAIGRINAPSGRTQAFWAPFADGTSALPRVVKELDLIESKHGSAAERAGTWKDPKGT